MRKLSLTIALAGALLAGTRAGAVPGTCTITDLDVIGTFPFQNIGGVGVGMPVDVDPATGRFEMRRDVYATQYPDPGLRFPTGFGPDGFIDMDPGVVAGTVDGSGQATLPGFAIKFGTDFQGPVESLPINPTLSTGLQVGVRSGDRVLIEGKPLDAGGSMRLAGADLLTLIQVNLTGIAMECTLAPAPDLASLPKAPSLAAVTGKGKLGGTLVEGDAGDQLTLMARLVPGAAPLPLDGSQDVIVRLRPTDPAARNLLVLRIPAGALRPRGKKFTATDTDGTVIEVITGHKESTDASSAFGGTLLVKPGKKSTMLVLKLKGLDLSAFAGSVDVAVAAGAQNARRMITVTAGKKGPKFR